VPITGPVTPPADPGTYIDAAKRYRVVDVLGAGAFGIVYDERWKTHVALKTLHAPSPELRQWLKAEYRTLRDIVHPNLVGLHELYTDGEQCFFTMDIVRDAAPFTQRLSFDRAGSAEVQQAGIQRICRASRQLMMALQTVHANGRCHRDIKPTNVLVASKNGGDHVVLLDFGMASAMERNAWLDTGRGVMIGTLPYMAPEQYAAPRASPTADLYSLGVMLYEAFTGKLPFEGEPDQERQAKLNNRPLPARERVPALPVTLDTLLESLLSPAPRLRPRATEVLEILTSHAGVIGEEQTQQPPEVDQLWGRDAQLATLNQAFEASLAPRLVTVDVIGPSGIGKSALVRHFLRGKTDPESDAVLLLEARCSPLEAIPYKAFDAVLDDLARFWITLSPKDAAALCPVEGVDALLLLFPELRRVPILAETPRAPRDSLGDPRALRERGFQALRYVLRRVRQRQPVVLWIDDIQWADIDSAALIEGVFGAAEAPPILLIVSRRPDQETAHTAVLSALTLAAKHGTNSTIEVGPLDAETARRLTSTIAEQRGALSKGSLQSIVEESAGIPYLIAELAHFAAAHPERDKLTLATGALTQERLRSLSPEDRALVEVAAISAGPLPAQVLLEAAGQRDRLLDRGRLRDLCLSRLMRWIGDDERLQIYHDRLREFVVGGLEPTSKVEHHRRLLSILEGASLGDPEQLLTHALEALDTDKTRRYALEAAQRAESILAFEQAARLYEVALQHTGDASSQCALQALAAESLANAGHSTRAAPAFERASSLYAKHRPEEAERRSFLRRQAGEQYLKAGHFDDGLRLMEAFLAQGDVTLPKSGARAMAVSLGRRAQLYLRGFDVPIRPTGTIPASTRTRLADLWAATTSLSMMDPVRADAVGLLHFQEALKAGDGAHIARSLGYEAAFASLIGGNFLRSKARDLLQRNERLLGEGTTAYERAFYLLGAGTTAFFHSDWDGAVSKCDAAADTFRRACRGAEYEAAVALVFSFQALGQAGRVTELVERIPAAIREADARGDLFAANNYRGGFHALGRIAAGKIEDVQADLRRVVETWKPGFYQMHSYHRVFAGVAADLYVGNTDSAVARIETDWPVLEAGLFLRMELPAVELRWTRARAALGLATTKFGKARDRLLSQATALAKDIEGATVPAAAPHAALLRAGIASLQGDTKTQEKQLRGALDGYAKANMSIHREVARSCLASRAPFAERERLLNPVRAWREREGVPDMQRLARVVAPGLSPIES
jgi:hypothetical protein